MKQLRLSTPADVPALRTLWTLAFGDGDAYLDNFFDSYYRPERMLVLEEKGGVQAMTAWFDTTFHVPGQRNFRAAYLYAVATQPDYRGQGLAGKLLAWADEYFRSLSIPAVTTVPAEPSLHNFFRSNGFRECFVYQQKVLEASVTPAPSAPFVLQLLTAEQYGAAREAMLAGTPHICFPEDALTYQEGCCRLSGGGFYRVETPFGPVLLCAEGTEDGTLMLKELLGGPESRRAVAKHLFQLLPKFGGLYRTPGEGTAFGMLKWLDPVLEQNWNWDSRAYLGFGFD